MKDRIQIEGEWYIKESTLPKDRKHESLMEIDDILTYKGALWENGDFCFEATFDIDTNALQDIEFTDKRNDNSEYWDNSLWFDLILSNDQAAMYEIDK